jgi:hypothetical protein
MELIIKEIPIKKELHIKKHMEHMKQLKKNNIQGHMRPDLHHTSLMTKKIIDRLAKQSKPHARDNEFFQAHNATRKSEEKTEKMHHYEEEKARKNREEMHERTKNNRAIQKEERERKNREETHEKRQTKKKDTKEVEMSLTSLKKEHKHLIEVLKSGSLKDRMKEAKSQGKEMKKY